MSMQAGDLIYINLINIICVTYIYNQFINLKNNLFYSIPCLFNFFSFSSLSTPIETRNNKSKIKKIKKSFKLN